MKRAWFLGAVLIAIFIFTGCHNNNQIEDDNVIKIGAILPLTGELAKLGESGKNGLLLAEWYINTKKGKKIKIILEDGQGKPSVSINALNKLISINKLTAIFSIVSPVDLSILPIQKKQQFLFISHSTHPKLSGVNDLVFRHSTTAQQESSYIANYLKSDSCVVVVYSNDDYGFAFSQQMTKLRPKWAQISFNKDEVNYSAVANKINSYKKYKVILCSAGKNIANIITKLREKGNDNEVVTSIGYKSSGADLLNKGDDNITMLDFKKIKIGGNYSEVSSKFFKEKGRNLNPAEIIFFNSGLLLYKAAASAESISPKNIAYKIRDDSYELLGGVDQVTGSNDIMPEIEFVKNK